MKIKGKLSVSRISSTDPRGNWIRITLEDKSSCIEFASVDIDFKQFGQAVTGLSSQLCDIELRGLDMVGKKMEYKKELIPVPRDLDKSNRERDISLECVKEVFVPYEVDGWVGRRTDIFNHHNYRGSHGHMIDHDCYEVSFIRYV